MTNNEMAHLSKSNIVSEILDECIRHSPGIEGFLSAYGNQTLKDYFEHLYVDYSYVAENSVIKRVLDDIFPTELRPKEKTFISSRLPTPFHAGVLTEPASFQSILHEAVGAAISKVKSVIVFLCGAVRLNNQTYPRGVFFDSAKVPLFPNDSEQRLSLACEPLTEKMMHRFLNRARKAGLSTGWMEAILNKAMSIAPSERFVRQASLMNYFLFKEALDGLDNSPSIYALPLEDVTSMLLMESFERDDIFSKMCLDPKVREIALKAFDGIQGAWTGKSRGTQFFTASDQKKDQTGVFIENGYLIGREREFRMEMTKQAIIDGLKAHSIAPGVFLSLMLLCDRGHELSGGYMQCSYLPEMSRQMQIFLNELNWRSNKNLIMPQRPIVSYGMISLIRQGMPCSTEFFMENASSMCKVLQDKATRLSVNGAFACNLPQIYHELVPRYERKSHLSAFSYKDAFNACNVQTLE